VTPNPSFKVTVQFKGKYLANGASDPLHVWFQVRVFGVGGSNGAICGSIKSNMVAGGHLGMMALLRVTLASAGLSCSRMQAASMLLWSGRPCKQAIVFRD